MPPPLKVRLLGEFQLIYDGQSIQAIDSVRLQSLCAYLASRPEISQSRSKLAFSFWPDSTEKQALTNLRHLLHKLRHALPEPERFVHIDARSIYWKADSDFSCDVSIFEKHLKLATESSQKGDISSTLSNLASAAEVYQGDFLPGQYEDWIANERERLRREYAKALTDLIQIHEDRRDYKTALDIARRWEAHEPTHEAAYLKLMSLYALAGDRAAALDAYQRCEAILKAELGVAPSRETQEFRDSLRQRVGDAEAPNSTAIPAEASLLPLQGRQDEWKCLKNLWTNARNERAHLVSLNGEAGIGKTRLAEELCHWVESQGGSIARSRSYSAEGRLAYAPAIQWLRSPGLFSHISNLNTEWLLEVSRILPELKGNLSQSEANPISRPSTLQRQHLFEALSRALLSSGKPLLLLLDDMQWTDEETLQWLAFLFRFAPQAKLLVVSTIRQEEIDANPFLKSFLLDMRREDFASEIKLGALQISDTLSIAEGIAGRCLSSVEASRLHDETEGNPLFVVESVRAGMESDDRGFRHLPNPFEAKELAPKVQAVIAKRLALLSEESRELANIAAIMGRAFYFEALVEVCGQDEERGAAAFDELLRHRIVEEHEGDLYDFTHDKLREVAYDEISSHRKRILHRKTAECLEALSQTTAPSQIAAHYERAGKPQNAARFYRIAAEGALQVHAEIESIRLYQKALALIEKLPEGQKRDELELDLSAALGVVIVAVQGYNASEALTLYERARAICKRLGRASEPNIIRAIALHHLSMSELQSTLSLGFELLQRNQETKEQIVGVEGNYTVGVAYFWLGQFDKSNTYLERSLALYNPEQSGIHINLYAQDPKAICLCRSAWTLWYLGYPDQAQQRMDEAVEFVKHIDHRHTKAYVYYYGAQAYADFLLVDKVQELIDLFSELLEDSDFRFWEARVVFLRAYVACITEHDASRIDELKPILFNFPKNCGLIGLSSFFANLAYLCLQNNRINEGLETIAHGFNFLDRADERFSAIELLRVKGELLNANGEAPALVEASLQKALKNARDSNAKTLELRVAMSLGKYWREQGKATPAHALLQDTYNWFTEGFELPDLQQARSLLAEWSS